MLRTTHGLIVGAVLLLSHPAIATPRAADVRTGEDLSAALAAAIQAGETRFRVRPGVYRFERSLELRQLDGFTLEGDGATLVFGRGGGQLVLQNCRRCVVKGLTLDMDPLPFTQGTVVAVDAAAQAVEFRLDPDYPSLDTRPTQQTLRFAFFDPSGERELPVLDNSNPRLATVESGVHRAFSPRFFNQAGRPLAAGDRVAVALKGSGGGISLRDCAEVRVEDLTIWAAGGFAIRESGFAEGGHTYLRCRVVRRPGSGRLMVGASDGLHSITQRKGPRLQDCEISHCFDDLVNIHGFVNIALEQRDGWWRVLCPAGQDFGVGSRLLFYASPNAEPLGEATIKSCRVLSDSPLGEVEQRVREHFRGSYGGLRLRSFMRPQVCELEFDRPVALKPYDFVSCPDFGGSGAVVEDCHFHDGHVRGILLKSSDSVVARCRFERVARSGLVLAPEIYWLEGPFPQNIRIEGNTFIDCGYGAVGKAEKHWEFAPLQVVSAFSSRLFPPLFSSAVNMQGIRCMGNRIVRAPGPGIFIMNTADVTLEENRVIEPGSLPGERAVLDLNRNLPATANLAASERDMLRDPSYGILLMSVRSVRAAGNQVEGGKGLVGKGWGVEGLDLR